MKLVCFACCAITCAVQAQTQTNKTLPLSLQQAVELAVEHNLDVQIQRYTPLNDTFLLAEATAAYEPALNTSVRRQWAYQPSSISATGVQNLSTRSDDSTFSAGIGGAGGGLATTPWGLGYSLSTTIDKTTFRRFDENSLPFLFDQGTTFAGITLQQPLLRNFWIDATRRDILIARKTIKFDELGFRLQVINIIAQTEQAYYDLVYDVENVKVQQEAVELAAEQAREDRKRVEVGSMSPLDEQQTESQLASSRAALLAAQQTLGTQQNVVKSLISDKFTEIYNVTIVPTDRLVAVPETLDLQESWRTGVKMRPDLQQAKVDLERRGITLRYSKNQLFPEVDLTGTYGRRGVEPTVGAALDDIPEDRFPTYSYGIVVSVPLGARSQRAAYRSARASIETAQLQYKKAEQIILIAIENAVGNINSSMEKIRADREAREYAEAALQAGRKKLEVGRSTTFEVLGLQSKLTAARTAEIQSLAEYNKAHSVLTQWEGMTLEKHRLNVKVK